MPRFEKVMPCPCFSTIATHLPGPREIPLRPTLLQSILYFQSPVAPLAGTLISPVHSDSKVLNLTGYTEMSPSPTQWLKHLQSRPANQCLSTLTAGPGYKCQHQWIWGRGGAYTESKPSVIPLPLTMAAAISSGLSPSRSNRNVTILLL